MTQDNIAEPSMGVLAAAAGVIHARDAYGWSTEADKAIDELRSAISAPPADLPALNAGLEKGLTDLVGYALDGAEDVSRIAIEAAATKLRAGLIAAASSEAQAMTLAAENARLHRANEFLLREKHKAQAGERELFVRIQELLREKSGDCDVPSLAASPAPQPEHLPHALGDWLSAIGELYQAMGCPAFNAQSPTLGVVETLREAAKRLAAAHAATPTGEPNECAPADAQIASAAQNRRMRQALQFYAEGGHFARHQPDAWDTVSGEPANFYEDEAATATVEDGSVAKAALAEVELPCTVAMLAATRGTAAQAPTLSQAALDVMAERQRQIEAKGYSRQRDADLYDSNDLARAAAFYAMAEVGYEHGRVTWPWEPSRCKLKSRYLNFTRAAALLIAAAEVEQARTLEPQARVAR